jgi:hypothetical protein
MTVAIFGTCHPLATAAGSRREQTIRKTERHLNVRCAHVTHGTPLRKDPMATPLQRGMKREMPCFHNLFGLSTTLQSPYRLAFVTSSAIKGRSGVMPELSRFLGIVITMYYRDHAPPHFHALHGDFEITVEIAAGRVQGKFPQRLLASVQEWRQLRRTGLLEAWARVQARRPALKIKPLE